MHPFEEHESELSDYFCSWIYVALGLLVFENVFCFVCNREDTIQYHGGLRSRELGQAPMLLVFLTPRQVLSSHPLQQMVWLYWLQDRDSIPNWYTINHPTKLHAHNETQWPTAARRWHFAQRDVSCRQSCHLLTPSHPPGSLNMTILWASSVWTLVHCVVKYSRPPDLKSFLNVSLPFAWITGPATDPS